MAGWLAGCLASLDASSLLHPRRPVGSPLSTPSAPSLIRPPPQVRSTRLVGWGRYDGAVQRGAVLCLLRGLSTRNDHFSPSLSPLLERLPLVVAGGRLLCVVAVRSGSVLPFCSSSISAQGGGGPEGGISSILPRSQPIDTF